MRTGILHAAHGTVDDLLRTWDLVHMAQAGDRSAMNRLFERYYERVRRAVRARIGARLRARLETADILQPAFAKAFENFDRFEMRDEASLLHWLAEYAVRQLRDAADRENADKRRPPAPLLRLDSSHDGAARVDPPDRAPPPVEQAAVDEQQAAMEQCLDEMPEHYRMVIVLRDYDGLGWYEVAAKLGKNTDSAARELHRRALAEFTLRMGRRGFGPGTD